MNAYKKITLDLQQPGSVRVWAAQDDVLTRGLRVTLLNDGLPWAPPEEAYAQIRYLKPDGTGGLYDTLENGESAWSANGNVVTVTFAGQMLTVTGDVRMTVNFYSSSGERLSTFALAVTVPPDVLTDAEIVSRDYFNVLTATLSQMAEYADLVKAAYGAPLTAPTAADMTDRTRIYVYTGTEPGYDFGWWYYYSGSEWVRGGLYNASGFDPDAAPTEDSDNVVTSGGVWAADAQLRGDITALGETVTGQGEDIAALDQTVAEHGQVLDGLEILITVTELVNWTQGRINDATGGNQTSTTMCRKPTGLIQPDCVLQFPGFNARIYAYSGAPSTATYLKDQSILTPIVGEDVDYTYDLSDFAGLYLYIVVSIPGSEPLTPSMVTGVQILRRSYTDPTLTQSGKAADAKAAGDRLTAVEDDLGTVTTASFTKPASGNAVVNFAYPVKAGEAICFEWSGPDTTDNSSLGLYSRATASGSNVETLQLAAKADRVYTVTPTVDAAYLRASATVSGSIRVFPADSALGDIEQLKAAEGIVPFVQFDFLPDYFDVSSIFASGGEIGDIRSWDGAAKAQTYRTVHAAFDALCAAGGAGHGYGERMENLYKTTAADEALIDLIAPDYVTSGVAQGQTVTLTIGTDSSGDPVTAPYTYESTTEGYDVRLYRFASTNNALHTNKKDIQKKRLLLIGGVHGNEFCAPIDLYVFAKQLCTDYTNLDILKLRSAYDVYILPYLNGFGCQYQWTKSATTLTGTRSNGHLVDINRNFPTRGWVGLTGTAAEIESAFNAQIADLSSNTNPGPSNGSEFEAQLVREIIDLIRPDVVIDHHHNSGTPPFYSTSRGPEAGNLIYQAAVDTAYARMRNLPQYYGRKYKLFLASDVSPATKAAPNGHLQTMAYELGIPMSCTNEMPDAIGYLDGETDADTKAETRYSPDVFRTACHTLLIEALHLCQWAMEH